MNLHRDKMASVFGTVSRQSNDNAIVQKKVKELIKNYKDEEFL
jgi:hypothetical protein